MSVNDMIKKSVLNSFSQYNVPKMALVLLVALLVGIVIYCVYRRFYTGVVYSRSFAVTLVGMCVLTCMVTLAISTNIVSSKSACSNSSTNTAFPPKEGIGESFSLSPLVVIYTISYSYSGNASCNFETTSPV